MDEDSETDGAREQSRCNTTHDCFVAPAPLAKSGAGPSLLTESAMESSPLELMETVKNRRDHFSLPFVFKQL